MELKRHFLSCFSLKTWSIFVIFVSLIPSIQQCGTVVVIALEIRSSSPKHSPICFKGRHRLQKWSIFGNPGFHHWYWIILGYILKIYKDMLGMFQCLFFALCSSCIMRCGNPWEGPTHQRMLQQAIGMKIKMPSFGFSLTHPFHRFKMQWRRPHFWAEWHVHGAFSNPIPLVWDDIIVDIVWFATLSDSSLFVTTISLPAYSSWPSRCMLKVSTKIFERFLRYLVTSHRAISVFLTGNWWNWGG